LAETDGKPDAPGRGRRRPRRGASTPAAGETPARAELVMGEILESAGEAIYALDADLKFTYINPSALELWAKKQQDLVGRPLAELFPGEQHTELVAAHQRSAGQKTQVEVELAWPGDRWVAVNIYPTASGLSVFLRDVSERKRAEERQRMLMAELQHRVKNILAVVRSITARTLEASDGLDDFAAHFDGRLSALARAQGALARQAGAELDLDEIVREELLTHAARDERIEIGGPVVKLNQIAAEAFALAVHELATNAVKYGALASPAGRISVTWRTAGSGPDAKLLFAWRETGVAVMNTRPSRVGFGRDLIERGLPYDLPGAATSLTFSPGGLHCVIELPLNKYAAQRLNVEDREGTNR
jgi:two-component system CheB/CheR fusion protein